ncbi:MAG: hypothetical protein AABY15_07175 [Nanoarchaeota archaeon]
MGLIKYIFWVTSINEDSGVLWAEGHKQGDGSGLRSELEITLDSLKNNISEKDYQELTTKLGRIFEYYYDDEDESNDKIIVPYFKPLSEQQIKEIEDKANEMAKSIKWDDDKSDSSDI